MAKYQKLSINDFGTFDDKNKNYNDGIFTLQLTSWAEFHNVVKIFNNNTDYFWRGQTNNKPLLSSFDRYFTDKKTRQKELSKVFNKLKQRLSDLKNINALTTSEIWAIGQHYGWKTPLLDWTESPYISAYFSFYEKGGGQTNNRIIYALNKALKLLIKGKERFIEFDLPNDNFDYGQNQRLINQKGRFTMALEGQDIKSVLKKFWEITRNKNKYTNEIILAEILIPDKFHDESLNSLKSMNITHEVLFPDYAGAVDICKIDIKEDNVRNVI